MYPTLRPGNDELCAATKLIYNEPESSQRHSGRDVFKAYETFSRRTVPGENRAETSDLIESIVLRQMPFQA